MFEKCKCPKCETELYIDRGLTNQCGFCGCVIMYDYNQEPDIANVMYDSDGKVVRDIELYDLAKECDKDPDNKELSDRFEELIKKRAEGITISIRSDDIVQKYKNKQRCTFKLSKVDCVMYVILAISAIFLWVADKVDSNIGDYINILNACRFVALGLFILSFGYVLGKYVTAYINSHSNRNKK